jgi:hypothetical protein
MINASGAAMSPGLWYFASEQMMPRLGGFLQSYSSDLTVYWHGQVGIKEVAHIIQEAENAFVKTGEKFQGSIDAYGTPGDEGELHLGPERNISKMLVSPSVPTFEACRAELKSSHTKIVLWAEVAGQITRPLEEGGENISVSIPQRYFFDGPFRPVILHAVSRTLPMRESDSKALLDDLTTAIAQKKFVPGN